jgi:hypothetical protein
MKYIITLILFAGLIAAHARGPLILSLAKHNRGLFGYKMVNFDYTSYSGTSTLGWIGVCEDPGNIGCRPPSGHMDEADEHAIDLILDRVEKNISEKIFQGSDIVQFASLDGAVRSYEVVWACDDLGDGQIDIYEYEE